jgi:hypothetical protein
MHVLTNGRCSRRIQQRMSRQRQDMHVARSSRSCAIHHVQQTPRHIDCHAARILEVIRDHADGLRRREQCEDVYNSDHDNGLAHDGYEVTFSWHELFNTPVGERVLVAFERAGEPLGVEDGAPVLFSAADILPAPRHVKRLARIVARVIQP